MGERGPIRRTWSQAEGRMGPQASPCQAPSDGLGHRPKGERGPQQVQARPQPTDLVTGLPLQGKVPEGRMGPPESPCRPHQTDLVTGPRGDGAPSKSKPDHIRRTLSQTFPSRGRCPKGGWGPQRVHAGPIRRTWSQAEGRTRPPASPSQAPSDGLGHRPKGERGPQQVQARPHPTDSVSDLPLQGKVPEGRMGPPASPCPKTFSNHPPAPTLTQSAARVFHRQPHRLHLF